MEPEGAAKRRITDGDRRRAELGDAHR